MFFINDIAPKLITTYDIRYGRPVKETGLMFQKKMNIMIK